MNLSPETRIAGVLAPLFALRTEQDLGIGDVEGLRQFVEWVAAAGFKLVQLLPVNETGPDHSPYNAISSMAIDPTTLHLAPGSPVDLTREDFDATIANVDFKKLRGEIVPYEIVKPLKRALLEKAFARFQKHGADAHTKALAEFCETEANWLRDYTLFRVLMEENGDSEMWDAWPEEHRDRTAANRWIDAQDSAKRAALDERRRFYSYVQWVAAEQWAAAKAHAEKRGVALMGDIPFGVSYYSADVFAQPEQFLLDWSGGAPPEPYFKDDLFTQKWGQNWGIPLYNWEAMRRDQFAWWRRRVTGVRRLFHVFRIDHILGFYRIYSFPWRPQRNAEFLPLDWAGAQARTGGPMPHFAPRDDDSAENSEANRRDGEEYLRVVLAEAGATRLVGEDLGTVPPYVRPNLAALEIAGFKIPQWETWNNGPVTAGNDYPRLSVATYATHDHKPMHAMWEEAFGPTDENAEQSRGELAKIAQFAGIAMPGDAVDYVCDFLRPAIGALFQSNAWIAILMTTDLLARTDRFNVPGTATASNWSRRMHLTVAGLRKSRTVREQMGAVRKSIDESGRL